MTYKVIYLYITFRLVEISMANLNRAIVMGVLGRDPEVKNFTNGSIATFSVATSESWKDKTTGERKDQTEWHRIVVNGRLVDVVTKYLKKGSKVYIEGSLRTRRWQDQNNNNREQVEIRAETLQLL